MEPLDILSRLAEKHQELEKVFEDVKQASKVVDEEEDKLTELIELTTKQRDRLRDAQSACDKKAHLFQDNFVFFYIPRQLEKFAMFDVPDDYNAVLAYAKELHVKLVDTRTSPISDYSKAHDLKWFMQTFVKTKEEAMEFVKGKTCKWRQYPSYIKRKEESVRRKLEKAKARYQNGSRYISKQMKEDAETKK